MKSIIITLAILFQAKLIACDMCGNFMGITPYDNQGQLMFLHRYRVFNGYRTYQQNSKFFVPGAYKTEHDPHGMPQDSVVETKNHSSKDFESYKVFELRAKFFIHSRWELNMILPFQQIKTKYNDEKSAIVGMADPSVFAGYHLLKKLEELKIKQRLIMGAGLKFPLGNDSGTDPHGKRLFLLNQIGTGSWDCFFYLNYMMSKKFWGINSNSLIKSNGKNNYNERYATSLNQVLSVFARVELKNITLYPSLLTSYEYSKGLWMNGQLLASTNVNVLLLGPSIDIRYKKYVLNISYQFNAYERVSSQSLANAGRFVVAVTYNFAKNN